MESLAKYGIELNTMSGTVGLIVGAVTFYIIHYHYLKDKEDKDKDKDNKNIIYSTIAAIIVGILAIFLYSKINKRQCNNMMFGNSNSNLLNEDFFGNNE